jgi:hypothetical protein
VPSFVGPPYGIDYLVSSDDGEWYAAKLEVGSKPPHVGIAIWRRGVTNPCYFVTSQDLRTFHLVGLAPMKAEVAPRPEVAPTSDSEAP